MGEKTRLGRAKVFLTFGFPALFFFSAVVVVPVIYGLYLTFTNWDGISQVKDFVWLENYRAVFADGAFWQSLWLTIRYVVVSVFLINLLAFVLAYLLTSGVKGQNFLRSAFFTPNLIGGIVLGFIWQFVFNRALTALGGSIPFFANTFLGDPAKAFWAMVIVTVWQYSGYMMIIYVAGFMGIPRDLIEAAGIDGCTSWQTTRKIVLPLMAPSFVICLFLSIQRCFMVYDLNLSLTDGGPYNATRMVAMHVYDKAFLSREYGVGQAEAFVLFVVVAAICITQVVLGKRREVEA